MQFLVEWADDACNASIEERVTLCRLQILVRGVNSCLHWDEKVGAPSEWVTVPAVHLATGIAADWWSIFESRGLRYPISSYRTGFILPDLSFSCSGSVFEVSGDQLVCENSGLRFWIPGVEQVPRHEAEVVLSRFIQDVVDKLADAGVSDGEVTLRWARVSRSLEDLEEKSFCEAAGALGLDPYSADDVDASFIEEAGKLFEGKALCDFMAGVRGVGRKQRTMILDVVKSVERIKGEYCALPGLAGVAKVMSGGQPYGASYEEPQVLGYRLARELRSAVGVSHGERLGSVAEIAKKLGSTGFKCTQELPGLGAVINRGDDVWIHLPTEENDLDTCYNFARAIGDVVCFPDDSWSVVSSSYGSDRQATGRAFAAEFLAPSEEVWGMRDDGWGVYDISREMKVPSFVVEWHMDSEGKIKSI